MKQSYNLSDSMAYSQVAWMLNMQPANQRPMTQLNDLSARTPKQFNPTAAGQYNNFLMKGSMFSGKEMNKDRLQNAENKIRSFIEDQEFQVSNKRAATAMNMKPLQSQEVKRRYIMLPDDPRQDASTADMLSESARQGAQVSGLFGSLKLRMKPSDGGSPTGLSISNAFQGDHSPHKSQ